MNFPCSIAGCIARKFWPSETGSAGSDGRVSMGWLMVLGLLAILAPDRLAVAQDSERPEFSEEELDFFEKRIRPVLVDSCYECHGPDSEFDGGLSVSSRKDLLKGGDSGPALRPGDSQSSLLIEAIRHGDRVQMPPDGKLPAMVQADFIRWVEMRAAWPADSDVASQSSSEFDLEERKKEHWAWQPLSDGRLPTPERSRWANVPLDHFVMAGLEQAGLSPATDATPTEWLRRVYFDLTGMPPTPDVVDYFQQRVVAIEASAPARQQLQVLKADVVDQLLAQPSYGEHWARHWLDLVRFAETHGHEFDYPILNAYEYRDYVIRALNQDVSYQRLVAEHIAGDLLPNARYHPDEGFNESVLGTSFWYLGEANHAPVDSLIDEAGRMDNQIDVVGKAFLGMTVACARCHDHKFDAISARDYYAWAGVLQSMRRDVGVIDTGGRIEECFETAIALDQEVATLLSDEVESIVWNASAVEYLLSRIDQLREDASAAIDNRANGDSELPRTQQLRLAALARWLVKLGAGENVQLDPDNPVRHLLAYARRPITQDVEMWWADYRRQLQGQVEQADQFTETAQLLGDWSSIREPEWSQTGWAFRQWENPDVGALPLLRSDLTMGLDSRRWAEPLPGTLRSPSFEITASQIAIRMRGNKGKVRLVVDSYRMNQFSPLLFSDFLVTENEDRWHWRILKGDLGRYLGHQAFLEFIDEGEGGLGIAEVWIGPGTPVSPLSKATRWLAEETDPPEAFADRLALYMSGSDKDPGSKIAWHVKEKAAYQTWLAGIRFQMESVDSEVVVQWEDAQDRRRQLDQQNLPLRTLYVATGGTPEDQPVYVRGNTRNLGEPVPHGNLAALKELHDGKWLDRDPSGRLALAYELASPNNPLTSRVYVNRIWHWLMGRGIVATTDNFGVLGEAPTHPELLDYLALQLMENGWSTKAMIREIVLSRTYGMSSQGNQEAFEVDPENRLWHSARVKRLDAESIRDTIIRIAGMMDTKMYGTSVPTYLTTFMQGRGRPESGPLDGQGRRSIYLEVRRNFMNPLMLVFDAPVPLSSAGNRGQSNVPAQALALLNDPLMEVAAGKWVQRIMDEIPNTTDGYKALRLEQMFLEAFSRSPSDAESKQLLGFVESQGDSPATWKAMAHVIFNLKEFIYVR